MERIQEGDKFEVNGKPLIAEYVFGNGVIIASDGEVYDQTDPNPGEVISRR